MNRLFYMMIWFSPSARGVSLMVMELRIVFRPVCQGLCLRVILFLLRLRWQIVLLSSSRFSLLSDSPPWTIMVENSTLSMCASARSTISLLKRERKGWQNFDRDETKCLGSSKTKSICRTSAVRGSVNTQRGFELPSCRWRTFVVWLINLRSMWC